MSKESTVQRQIEEIKSKIALLEGDRKAYWETSKKEKEDNDKKIIELRKENKELRKKLRDKLSADDHVINEAFKADDKKAERAYMSNKSGKEAISAMDNKVCDARKKLNQLKYVSDKKQATLDALKKQHEEQIKDQEECEATDKGENEQGKRLRDLQNRSEKASHKLNEAVKIKKTYERIKASLQEEHLTFGNTLDDMEKEIIDCRKEIKDIESKKKDAEIREAEAKRILEEQEQTISAERKAREIELSKMKKEAEEKKLQHEKMERRLAQRTSISNEDTMLLPQSGNTEDQQAKITTYEEAFKKIKEATGVSDFREVVLRFENQGYTRQRLEVQLEELKKQIQRKTEEMEALKQQYEEMKYSGEAKISSGQAILEKYREDLASEEARRDEIEAQLETSSKVLIQCKGGVEHLSERLVNLKVGKVHAAQTKINPTSDEYVLDQLDRCEEKLLRLLEELQGYNLEEELKRMQETDFHAHVESKLPEYNIRINLPASQNTKIYDDDDQSGDDDEEVLTRQEVKKQSQSLIDQKTKRKAPRKKKKGAK